jgi:hypothetical protein
MKKALSILALLLFPACAFADPYPSSVCVSATPVADLAAYATGELIGGKLTFAGALRSQTRAGFITSVTVLDKAAQAVDLEVELFDEDPTATTFTDQAAFDPDDTDLGKMKTPILLGSTERFAYSDNSLHAIGSLSIQVGGKSTSGTILYGALVARGAYDGASASDLTVTICISQD